MTCTWCGQEGHKARKCPAKDQGLDRIARPLKRKRTKSNVNMSMSPRRQNKSSNNQHSPLSEESSSSSSSSHHAINNESDDSDDEPFGGLEDTTVCPTSHQAAVRACSVVCRGIDLCISGDNNHITENNEEKPPRRHIFCLVRPPGHHVGRFGRTEGCCSHGFCLLNNVAIGVQHAKIKHGVKRIAIIDFDVHFGNGTYEIFKKDPSTFFSSTHLRYEDGTDFFASELKGADDHNETLHNYCHPVQSVQHLHDTYESTILPRLVQFDPELIVLSSGFDGHQDDPLGGDLGM